MNRTNRYLMFYAILAVGLAISWSQVGRRTQVSPEVSDIRVLATEDNCRPLQAPCAAYAGNFALVLGPHADGLRLVGQGLPAAATLSVQHLDGNGVRQTPPLLQALGDSQWLISSLPARGRLRVNLLQQQAQWVAEFRLQ